MLDTTLTLARSFNTSPFDVMEQDCDAVIMLINYFVWKADNSDTQATANPAANNPQQQKIKVNNKTATGGWW